MKRKIRKPLDFATALADDAPDPIDEAVAAGAEADDDDLAIHAAPEPEVTVEPLPEPAPVEATEAAESVTSEPVQEKTPAVRREPAAPRRNPRREVAEPQTVTSGAPAATKSGGRWIYVLAAIASILWAAAPIAFYSGFTRRATPFDFEPFALTVFALLAIGPVALIWVLAFMLRQGARLAAEARFSRAQAEDMIRPAAIAAAGAGGAAELIRDQIEQAVVAAGQARHELITLREVLASETAQLVQATASSIDTAARLTQAIGDERRELSALTEVLKAQVEEVEDSITRQSKLVAESADLADAQIREAELRLANSAGDLAAAANEASNAAKTAGEDISRQSARLEAAGSVVAEQVRIVEDGLAEQRAALVTVAHELRAEQESFGAEVETRQAQLSGVLADVRSAASEMVENTEKGSHALQVLVENAADRFRDLGEAAAEERDLFSAATLKTVGALAEAAANERTMMIQEAQSAIETLSAASVQASQAAVEHTKAAKLKVDELSEAAFSAGQHAETAFQTRLNEARALIEQSTSLVEEAGARAGERLAEGLEVARTTVDRLEGLLQEIDARVLRLPEAAQAQGAEVQRVVEQGVEQLLGAARRAADETQAIDAAFQERVRRNYEMLSEAVRLMGVVGGAPAGAPRTPRPARPSLMGRQDPDPLPAASVTPPAAEEDAATRPRLRLTPEAIDEEVFEAPPERPSYTTQVVDTDAAEKELTWKEILSNVDEEDDAGDDGQGAAVILEEVRQLGIDPAALLPKSRIDEIAPVLQAGDQQGGREIVRALAPAAMRRLSRRVLTDPTLKSKVGRFIRVFEGRIDDAAAADHEGFAVAALLTTDEGRVFLLIDSAVSDLA